MECKCDSKQIQGLVKERNAYRRLLKRSQYAFNVMRNRPISESLNDTTYALASDITKAFKQFDQSTGDQV